MVKEIKDSRSIERGICGKIEESIFSYGISYSSTSTRAILSAQGKRRERSDFSAQHALEREELTASLRELYFDPHPPVREGEPIVILHVSHIDRFAPPRKNVPFSQSLTDIEVKVAIEQERYFTLRGAPDFDAYHQCISDFHATLERLDVESTRDTKELPSKDLEVLAKMSESLSLISHRIWTLWDASIHEFLKRFDDLRWAEGGVGSKFGWDISKLNTLAFSTPPYERDSLFKEYPDLKMIYDRCRVEKYKVIHTRLKRIQKYFKEQSKTNPEGVKNLLTDHYRTPTKKISEWALDDLIGIIPEELERRLSKEIREYSGREQYFYQGTPYDLIRDFLKEYHLTEDDTLYDLGCGYGRIPLYGAMTTGAQLKGIELVPERVVEANGIKERFGLDNVEFRQGNILEQDYSDGSVFFLFNPFTRSTLEQVGNQLEEIAKTKKIRVVSLSASNRYFEKQPWLKAVPCDIKHPWGLRIFESQ